MPTKISKTKALPDGGTLERLFGGSCAKILDFLSTFQEFDYNKQAISRRSGVSMRHALTAIDKLEKAGLIIKTREMGNGILYKYNKENKAAELLDKFNTEWACQECIRLAAEDEKQQTQKQTQEKILVTVPT